MTLDWRKAKPKRRGTSNIIDESESMKRDRAAQWLAINERKAEKKAKKTQSKKNSHKQRSLKPVGNHPPKGVIIYTDGACEPNPGIGGWAFVVYEDDNEIHSECGGDVRSTNNIMEMTAVLKALYWLKTAGRLHGVTIYSDSQYVVKGCTLWRHGWRRKNWHRSSGGVVANVDLWKEISIVLDTMKVRIEWVKGHSGIHGNERADELSTEGRLGCDRGDGVDPAIIQQLRYSI